MEIIDDSGEVASYQYCAADADIYVQTRYRYKHVFPMKYQEKQYSGQKKLGYYLEIFGKTFSFARKHIPYDAYDVVRQEHPLKLTENFYLPISWGKLRTGSTKTLRKYTQKEEAAQKAQENLDKFLQKYKKKGFKYLKIMLK